MEKRVSKRIISRVKVRFGPDAAEHLGFALNLSSNGLFLSSTRLFPRPTALRLRLEPIGGDAIDLRGQVRWGLRVPLELRSVVRPGMGILLEAPPRDYLDFFTRLVKLSPARANARLEARLEVRFYHREQFLKEYTENLSRGGLFVATEEIFSPGDEVRVDLVVPDLADVWQFTGRVAYRLDAGKARQLDCRPGVGIQITDADPRARDALQAYVQRIMRLYR